MHLYRYQDGNDAQGDAAGNDEKLRSSKDSDAAEADGYSMVDRNVERMRAAALEEETVRSCCVLVPLVRLPGRLFNLEATKSVLEREFQLARISYTFLYSRFFIMRCLNL